ncbi:MAG TPA: L,D-transpeptidase [Solirubrobacterales bacterium]|nr:L,D-transpeptidase [Solirubrobacterales bacterium]
MYDDSTTEMLPINAEKKPPRWKLRIAVILGALVVLVLAGFAAAAFSLSGASIGHDPNALARVRTETLGGNVERVVATGPDGKEIPIKVESGGRLVPTQKLPPGETVSLAVTFKRPAAVGWLVGETSEEQLTLRTPVAHVEDPWLTVKKPHSPRVAFDEAIRAFAYGQPDELVHRRFSGPKSSASLGSQPPAGSIVARLAPRSWEQLGKPETVTWFPKGEGNAASLAASPAPGSEVSPATELKLTFSKPVKKALGGGEPTISPSAGGKWVETNAHTLVFQPSGWGAGLSTTVEVKLPKPANVVEGDGSVRKTDTVEWTIPPGNELRLQQLLAQAGYLPVSWKPSGKPVATTPAGELAAAVAPPEGEFGWRYPNVPSGLKESWSPGEPNLATEGALMAFESQHEMEPDGVAGAEVWDELLKAAIAGERNPEKGYSYVHVTESLPETVFLWHNGKQIFTTPANTGIPGAETELGTFPVYLRYEETTMSGENPDGSHYSDPGIMWVSYFNGGDALHAFDRASYGTPQSLGCVEMPLEAAAEVWPYTPIGTLVTIES